MARARVCSECPNTLDGKPPQTKTCGAACRVKRSRRLRANKVRAGEALALPEHQKEIQEIVRGEKDDLTERVIQDELRPVVREAITDDVLRAIADLLALTPTVVSKLREDLEDEDPTIRQKAYTLIAKYTMGQASLIPEEAGSDKQLVVNFELPRPDATPKAVEVEAEEIESETKPCDICGTDKPLAEFVDGSDRCSVCWEAQRKEVEERFGAG